MRYTSGSGRARCADGALSFVFRNPLPLAHGFLTLDHNGIRIVNNAVTDSIGKDGLADLVPPARNIELRAEDSGRSLVSGFRDLQQIPRLGLLQGIEQSFVQIKQGWLLVLLDDLSVGPVSTGDCKFGQRGIQYPLHRHRAPRNRHS